MPLDRVDASSSTLSRCQSPASPGTARVWAQRRNTATGRPTSVSLSSGYWPALYGFSAPCTATPMRDAEMRLVEIDPCPMCECLSLPQRPKECIPTSTRSSKPLFGREICSLHSFLPPRQHSAARVHSLLHLFAASYTRSLTFAIIYCFVLFAANRAIQSLARPIPPAIAARLPFHLQLAPSFASCRHYFPLCLGHTFEKHRP